AAAAGPVSLRSIGLDGLAVPTLPALALATQRLRRSPLPLLPAPTRPPMVGAPTPGALARALFPLGLHAPGQAASPGLAEPRGALHSALGKRQRHAAVLWPGTLRRRIGSYRHAAHLGPEPHGPPSSPLPGQRWRANRSKHLVRTQTSSLAFPRSRRRPRLARQVLRWAAPTPGHRQACVRRLPPAFESARGFRATAAPTPGSTLGCLCQRLGRRTR